MIKQFFLEDCSLLCWTLYNHTHAHSILLMHALSQLYAMHSSPFLATSSATKFKAFYKYSQFCNMLVLGEGALSKFKSSFYFKIWLQFVKLNVNAQDKTSFRVILRTSQEWTFSGEVGINIAGVLWYRQFFRNFFGGNCEQGINNVPFGTFNCSSSVNPSPTNHIYKIVECLGVEIK